MKVFQYFAVVMLATMMCSSAGAANWSVDDIQAVNIAPDYMLLLLGGLFVILMQVGFAIIEGGYDPQAKTFSMCCINFLAALVGNILYVLISYALMMLGWGDQVHIGVPLQSWHWNLLFFYVLMATTITMVVSRIIPKSVSLTQYWWIALFISFLIFSIMSRWVWGGFIMSQGFLRRLGFFDFAGASVVHSAAAWIVLAGYCAMGKEQQEQLRRKDILFSDYKLLAMALAGFILWLAWSGLNVSYIIAMRVDIQDVVLNTISTLIAAVITVILISALRKHSPGLELMIKSALGGLVAITASGGLVTVTGALWIGMVAGVLMYVLPAVLQRWIGAKNIIDVLVIHGICGVWGTMALAIYHHSVLDLHVPNISIYTQGLGVVVTFVWSFGLAFMLFKLIAHYSLRQKALAQKALAQQSDNKLIF